MLVLFACCLTAQAQHSSVPTVANPAIHGQGTPDTVPLFTSPTSIGDSIIVQKPNDFGQLGVGVGTDPVGRFDVLSNIPFGPTIVVANENPDGDVAIDFHSAGRFVGNIGLIQSGPPQRFFILFQSDDFPGLPLTLAENGGNVGIGTPEPTNILTIRQGAGEAISDGWATYSSRRYKTAIQPLIGALDKVERLRGVQFDWKNSGKHDIGLVAEEVAPVVPELVTFDQKTKDARSVDYDGVIALLVEAIKEQQKEIRELKAQIEAGHTAKKE
jgi:hypothetical protein